MATVNAQRPMQAVHHGLVVLSIIWQGLFVLAEITGGGGKPWFIAYLIGISATWLLVIVTTWWSRSTRKWKSVSRVVNIVMLLTWATIYLAVLPGDGGWEQGASVTNIAVGLVGFLAPTRWSLLLVPIIALSQFTLLYFGTREMLVPPSVSSDVLYGVYAWTIGYIAMFARRALLRAAGNVENSQESLVREEIQVKAMEEVSRKIYDDERRIHAIVLNTLTAFARGSLNDEALIRRQAAESASVLRHLVSDGHRFAPQDQPQWRSQLSQHLKSAQDVGLHVDVNMKLGSVIPEEVGLALAAATGEAINNVIRHAGATSIHVSCEVNEEGICTFSIRDDGNGLPADHIPGFGIRQGIHAIMNEVGGSAAIASPAHGGVEVQLTWQPHVQKSDPGPSNASAILASFATPVIVMLWLLSALRMALSWSDYESAGLNAAAFTWYTILAAFLWWQTRKGSVPGRVVIGISIAAPLTYVMQSHAGVSASASTWASWASEGVVSLFLVLIGAGPWWAFAPVMTMWLLMQGDLLAELFAPGFVILVATAFFARSIRRNSYALRTSIEQRIAVESDAVAAHEHLNRLMTRYALINRGDAVNLLDHISRGDLHVSDPVIQQRCRREEQLLRSVLRLDPLGSPLHTFLGEFALAAYEMDRRVHFDVHSAPTTVDTDELASFAAHAAALLRSSDPDEDMRLSVLVDGETSIARLVVPCMSEPDTVPQGCEAVRVERLGSDQLWLLEWEMIHAFSNH
jgi:signal transduction histidine kinase